jgi:hypothetical protein
MMQCHRLVEMIDLDNKNRPSDGHIQFGYRPTDTINMLLKTIRLRNGLDDNYDVYAYLDGNHISDDHIPISSLIGNLSVRWSRYVLPIKEVEYY